MIRRPPRSTLLSLHDALPICRISSEATAFPHRHLPWDILFLAQWTDPAQTNMHRDWARSGEEILRPFSEKDRKSTRLNSSHLVISYAVFCLKKKKINYTYKVI